ncbi:MAG: recombination protein RecR [Nitrospirae bacterium]|nr:recombination protein RecR [Nitrospirota bacterium]
MIPQSSFSQLVCELTKLPGVGQKTAQRLAFFLLKLPKEESRAIAQSILDVTEKNRFCAVCNSITEEELCAICRDDRRDRGRILVIEEPSTLYSIEKAGQYKGLYHVLLGAISPLQGVGPDEIKVKGLVQRVESGGVQEVILATNPNTDGEATALYLMKVLKPLGVRVSRIAYGVPVGSELEYADEVTLMKSLEGRREM